MYVFALVVVIILLLIVITYKIVSNDQYKRNFIGMTLVRMASTIVNKQFMYGYDDKGRVIRFEIKYIMPKEQQTA